jgi:hypothetical protein
MLSSNTALAALIHAATVRGAFRPPGVLPGRDYNLNKSRGQTPGVNKRKEKNARGLEVRVQLF